MSSEIRTATLKPREERRLQRGHLWAYRTEFDKLPELEDGELVDVYTGHRRFVGRGFYQAQGGIAVRLLARRQDAIGADFFRERIGAARALRERLFPGAQAYRWVFGESDGLPGLVADRFGGTVTVQSSCAFYRPWMDAIAGAFLSNEGVTGVRVQVAYDVVTQGEIPETLAFELEGMQVRLRLEGAQKTGMFLDQRLNRLATAPFAPGARVFDGHCHLGLWACHAARAGAREIIAADSAEAAIALARENAEANGLADAIDFRHGDVEAVLEAEEPFDLVIIDPPAFAKSRGLAKKAANRYLALNQAAIRATRPGGLLFTSSCSHFVPPADFLDILKRAAAAEKRSAQLLELRGASPDHPVLLSMPETNYLKCAVLHIA
ncbi:MAG: class I SAM-dependent rRNA methyltransferase [Candidatus Hydrogenedentes bacterium]|nr:class I SAM-dependent rRNA methyltransferase [Candidatus Hydrogenedentota bacterium]